VKTTRECQVSDLFPRLLELLKPHLIDNEHCDICVETIFNDGYYSGVITERRIASSEHGKDSIMGTILLGIRPTNRGTSILLEEITGYSERNYHELIYLTISSTGDKRIEIGFVSTDILQKFLSILDRNIKAIKGKQSQKTASHFERLQQLELMINNKLISEDEYKLKREEILRNL
jgi:hypothetical protein